MSYYNTPLTQRAASPEMSKTWGDKYKYFIWRTLWLELARTQKQYGLLISDKQIEELEEAIYIYNPEAVEAYESQLKHDVMAHIKALGDLAPSAKGIIHLGATSQFVVDNCDSIRIRKSLEILIPKIENLLILIGKFAIKHKDITTLGLTHFQPAQPTTVGKRAAMWGYDTYLVLEHITTKYRNQKVRSIKGATGTQASYLELFKNIDIVRQVEAQVAKSIGFDECYLITGQTYPRIDDAMLISDIAAFGAICQKITTDIRLLAGKGEMAEGFSSKQVGSSAMPYKKNPITCEKVCSLAKLLIGLSQTGLTVASEQWLERSLDDSNVRRMLLPEVFLAADGIVESMIKIFSSLTIIPNKIKSNLAEQSSMLITEKLLMIGVKNGADRQQLHEKIRVISLKSRGSEMMERLKELDEFKGIDLDVECSRSSLTGCAIRQVEEFYDRIIEPILAAHTQ